MESEQAAEAGSVGSQARMEELRGAVTAAYRWTAPRVVAGSRRAAAAARGAIDAVDADVWAHAKQLPLVALSQLGVGADVVPSLTASDKVAGVRPVLLIHGMGGRPGNFALLRGWWWLTGRRGHHAVDLRDAGTVDAMAARVADAIDAVCAVEGVAQLDLVAHSLGGIVARAALRDPRVAERVGRLVTIGTPHGGTYAARYAGTPVAHDLRPGSDLLASLGAPPVPTTTIVGTADVLVVPLESAHLEGATPVQLEGLTHYTVLSDRAALRAIDAALGR